MLNHLDNAMDLAEKYKGTDTILKKVSVVDRPKELSGKHITPKLLLDMHVLLYKLLLNFYLFQILCYSSPNRFRCT